VGERERGKEGREGKDQFWLVWVITSYFFSFGEVGGRGWQEALGTESRAFMYSKHTLYN
jgi:hypothetical protein